MAHLRKGLLILTVVLILLLIAAGAVLAATPKHVMIVVMDQMKPAYAKAYDMDNVIWLQNRGVTFPNAWVGDMASETVVSHNVMVSGLYPKHMGWSDEAFRDGSDLIGYGENAVVTSGDLGTADYVKLIQNMDYPKLGDYLHHYLPGTIVANVGEKAYQVESMAASSSDYWVRMGSKKNVADLSDPSVLPWTGKYRGPSGNVPAYIASDDRFKISSGNSSSPAVGPDDYGTKDVSPAWVYPEDGRYAPSSYAGHTSGDVWVADAAMKIMENENWSGLWVTFSAIDKIGHMWGGGPVDSMAKYSWTPATEALHMPWAAKNADDQLGRLIAKLKELGEFKDTLIVVTADHASLAATKGWYGMDELNGGDISWYAGDWFPGYTTPTVPNNSSGPDALKPLMDTGKVAFSYQSTSIDTWLKDGSRTWADRLGVARVMQTLPGVIATYVKVGGDHYALASAALSSMTPSEMAWWRSTGQTVVNTMAWSGSADVVGLLADNTGYATFGDHGGAQKSVQRIPMVFWENGIKHRVPATKARLVDIMPTILKTMGMRQLAPMDGKAVNLGL